MDLSRLSAEEKRLKDWQHFIDSEDMNPDVKNTFRDEIKAFRNLLARLWEQESVSEQDQHQLLDMRRKLSQLMEEARLLSRP